MNPHFPLSRNLLLFTLLALSLALAAAQAGPYELPMLPPFPAVPAPRPPNSVPMGNPADFPEVKMDFPIENGTYEPTWASIGSQLPLDAVSLRENKFGIWVHFGPQGAGASGDWYAQHMYQQGSNAYDHHLKEYGHPTTSGYKDFLHVWNPKGLNPTQLTQIYYDAGARFLLVQGVHHDNFDNWDSKYNPWNTMNFGPKRDTMGEWVKAARTHKMGFGMAFHHEYSWWFSQPDFLSDKTGDKAGIPYDAATARNGTGWWKDFDLRMLYGVDLHEYQGVSTPNKGYWNPSSGIFVNHLDYAHWFANWWALRMVDAIEKYDPDFIYTDGTSTQPFSGSGTGTGYKCDAMQRVIAHLSNRAAVRRGKVDTFAVVKFHQGDRLTNTFETNLPPGIKTDQPWIGEVPVGDWFYSPGFTYDPGMVIHYLLECISRDGAAAVCISLQPDGSLDAGSTAMLKKIGEWMAVNGRGLYGSRAWLKFSEGSRSLPSGALGGNQAAYTFTDQDFRFTVGKDRFLYAYGMTVPPAGAQLKIQSLAAGRGGLVAPITSVELLGSKERIAWKQQADGLVITCPAEMSAFKTAIGFKIGPVGVGGDLPAPLNLRAELPDQANQVHLSWSGGSPRAAYTVKRAISPSGPFVPLAANLTAPNFTDTTVQAGVLYSYTVSTSDGGLLSPNAVPVRAAVAGSPTWFSSDIGDPATPGSTKVADGRYTVSGDGSDIWNTRDQFQYAFRPVNGDCTLVARVVGLQNTGSAAKAGLMIRETLAPDSKYALHFLSRDGLALQRRDNTGGSAGGDSGKSGFSAPVWLKLTRTGNKLASFQSADGKAWSLVGSTNIGMNGSVFAGLAVCSVKDGTLCEGVFDNVTLTGPATR